MKVHSPMLWSGPQVVNRTASMSPPQAPIEPTETLTLNRAASSPNPPSTEVLADASARVAAQTAANLDTSKGALTGLLSELQENGVGIRHRGRFLFWLGDFKDSDPEKAAGLVAKEKSGRVIATHRGARRAMAINDAKDIFELDAFYGSGNHFRTDHPELSKTIADMNKSGLVFIDRDSSYSESMGPFWAYNVLEGGEPIYFRKDDHRGKIQNSDEAALVAYLFDAGDASQTRSPEVATSLKLLWRAGAEVGGEKPWSAYRAFLEAEPDKAITVECDAALGEIRRDDLDDPEALMRKFMPWKELYDSLDQDSIAYQWISEVPSERQQQERVELAKGLRQARMAKEQYQTILEVAGKEGDLATGLELGVAIDEAGGSWEESFRRASSLKGRDRTDYLQVRQLCRSDEAAEAFWTRFDDPKERARALERTEQVRDWLKAHESARKAVEAVTLMGTKPDLDLMQRLFEKTEIPESLYPLGLGLKRESQEALVEVGQVCGTKSEVLEGLWPQVAAGGEERISERAAAWKGLVEAIDRDGLTQGTAIFSELAHNYAPDLLPGMTELYRLNLVGSGGRVTEAEKNWQKLGEFENPEFVTRMFAVTRDFEKASRLVKMAASTLENVPLSERVESLALVAERDSDPEKAFRFLALQHQNGESLKVKAELYSRARAVYDEPSEARSVVGAYESSPHHASPEAAQRLAELLDLGGELHRIRDLWLQGESRTEPQRANDLATLKILNQDKKRKTEASLTIFRALMDYPAAGGGPGLAKIGRLRDLEGEKLELFLDTVVRTQAGAEKRARELEGFAEVCETVGMDSALEGWENLRPRIGSAELTQHAEMLKELRGAEYYNEVIASRRPGETLEDLKALAGWTRAEGFADWRNYLEKSSPEGGELKENTAFMAALIREGDDPRRLIREAFAPLGNESTAVRRECLLKLRENSSSVDETVEVWRAITRHNLPGSADYREAVEIYPEMKEVLGDRAFGFMDFVRQEQERGATTRLATALKVVAPAAMSKRLSLEQLKEILLERGDTGVEIDEETVTVGDFTVLVNH